MTFVDTAYLFALFNPQDRWHGAAQRLGEAVSTPLITTDYVILEIADGMSRPDRRGVLARLLAALRSNEDLRVVPQSPHLFGRGLALYLARDDKEWSLTDCLSFVVMQDEGCVDALSSDIHFAQAGFRALLRDSR